ncbi:unnamed protein product [Amoebophrya sp. A120]|nr:unnamed protein product [Amoebophrya sp. A120]|eukprot:GSA120T00017839001.1
MLMSSSSSSSSNGKMPRRRRCRFAVSTALLFSTPALSSYEFGPPIITPDGAETPEDKNALPKEPQSDEVLENTPFPCRGRDDYSGSEIKAWIDEHLAGIPEQPKNQRRMLLLMGGSGAGKSTLVRKLREESEFFKSSFLLHGLDEYLKYLPEYQQSLATGKKYKDAADGCYSAAIRIAKRAEVEILKRGVNLVYEETGKDLDRIQTRVLPPYAAAGYQISLAFVAVTEEVALQRAHERFLLEGRHAGIDYIHKTFKNLHGNFFELQADPRMHTTSMYCDNSCTKYNRDTPQNCMLCWEIKQPENFDAHFLALPDALVDGEASFVARTTPLDYITERYKPEL